LWCPKVYRWRLKVNQQSSHRIEAQFWVR
jgi:hypothetical protein